jgi:2-dehydropantoate 2-reductase
VSNPKILVLGAGGIGGLFGGRLVESGADVTFLVREAGAKFSPSGLQIESSSGDAKLAVKTVVGQRLAPAFVREAWEPQSLDRDWLLGRSSPAEWYCGCGQC